MPSNPVAARLVTLPPIIAALAATAPAMAQDVRSGGAIPLPPVVVTGAVSADEDVGAADRSASIYVERPAIERRDPGDAKELFAGESNVSVGGAHRTAEKIYVNGIEENQLAVTVDGARQNRKIFHHSATNFFDPLLLKSVRVDPGVAPADAGPGALGGSIVFETVDVGDLLEPGDSFGGFATGSFGFNGDVAAGGLAVFGRAQGFEGLAFMRGGVGDDFEDGSGRRVFGTETDFRTFLLKGAYESPDGHRIELSGERIDDEADRPFRANIGQVIGRPDPVVREYDVKRENLVLNYELTKPQGLFDPRVTLAYSGVTLKVPEPFGSLGEAFGWNGKVENRFALGGGDSLTAGFDVFHDVARYEDPATPRLREKATNVGAYAQLRVSPVETVDLSGGVRADHIWFTGVNGADFEETGLSGNLSASWEIGGFLTVHAGYSNVYGGVALDEPFIFNPAWTYGGLDSVRSENVIAGLEVKHAGFFAGASIFRSDFENARDASFGGGPFIPFDFRAEGFSLAAGYNWGAGFIRASFTDSEVSSGGWITSRPRRSEPRTRTAPSQAVHGRVRLILSPISRLAMFGATRPTKGIAPTVETVSAAIAATMRRPTATIRPWASPSPTAASRPSPATVSRSAWR